MEEEEEEFLAMEEEEAPQAKAEIGPLKFSLSRSKPPLSRPALFPKEDGKAEDAQDAVRYVTEFDARGIQATAAAGKVIPRLENSWRPQVRMRNLVMGSDLSVIGDEQHFEMETLSAEGKPDVQYGLTVRSKKEGVSVGGKDDGSLGMGADGYLPRSGVEDVVGRPFDGKVVEALPSLSQLEERKLREDLEVLPEEMSLDAYESMPVEDFGEALLRGMGWVKGEPIGRNAKRVASPVEHVRRVGREGLGATPAPKQDSNRRSYKKFGETRRVNSDIPIGHDGRSRANGRASEERVEETGKGVVVGRVVSIIRGPYSGLRGEVIEKRESDGRSSEKVYLRLVEHGEKICIRADEVTEIGLLEEEEARKHIRQPKNEDEEKVNRGQRSDTRRNSSESGQKKEYRVEDGKKRSRTEDVERESDRASERWKGITNDKAADQDAFGRKDTKHTNAKHEKGHSTARRADWDDDYHHREKQRNKVDDMHAGKEEGRKKEPERREADAAFREEGSYRDRNSTSRLKESGIARGKDRSALRTTSDRKELLETSGYIQSTRQPWLRGCIRVRIVSKSLRSGRLYLKKARVVDVISPDSCDVVMDESGELVQDVRQNQLETALPKRGGRVVVLGGKHRGLVGKLLERDSEKEVALLQMEEDFEVLTLNLDDVAEFIGDN